MRLEENAPLFTYTGINVPQESNCNQYSTIKEDAVDYCQSIGPSYRNMKLCQIAQCAFQLPHLGITALNTAFAAICTSPDDAFPLSDHMAAKQWIAISSLAYAALTYSCGLINNHCNNQIEKMSKEDKRSEKCATTTGALLATAFAVANLIIWAIPVPECADGS